MKILLIILGSFIIIIGVSVLIINMLFSTVTSGFKNTFSPILSAHSNEDIIKYMKDKHNIEVRVIDNKGPKNIKTGDKGGAVVETNNENKVKFDVFINSFGAISGDNYEYNKAVKMLDHHFQQSDDLKQLQKNGYLYAYFDAIIRSKEFVVHFKLVIPDDLTFYDQKALALFNTAITTMKKWQEISSEYDLLLEEITVMYDKSNLAFDHILINLNESYDSIDELGLNIASNNIETFEEQFIYEDHKKIENITNPLNNVALQKRPINKTYLTCNQLIAIDQCGSYSVSLTHMDRINGNNAPEFRYDNLEIRENLFTMIQLLKEVDLPIDKVIVNHLYVPRDLDHQVHSEEELEQLDIRSYFSYQTVEITNIQEISSANDIYFE